MHAKLLHALHTLIAVITAVTKLTLMPLSACHRAVRSGQHPAQQPDAPLPTASASTALPLLPPALTQVATAVPPLTNSGAQPRAGPPLESSKLSISPQQVHSHAFSRSDDGATSAEGFGSLPIPGRARNPSWSPAEGQGPMQSPAVGLPGRRGMGPRAEEKFTSSPAQGSPAQDRPKGKKNTAVKKKTAEGQACRRRGPPNSPGWNSDFIVQHTDPVSIRKQELMLSRGPQGCGKQPSAAVPSVAVGGMVPESLGSWPVLDRFIQPCSPVVPAVHSSKPMPPVQPAYLAHQHHTVKHSNMAQAAADGSLMSQQESQKQPAVPASSGAEDDLQGRRSRTVYSRNLDSAQSPLRPSHGRKHASAHRMPTKLDKFCFLPVMVCCEQ